MNYPENVQLLVLGGGIDNDGKLNDLSVERAQKAAQHICEVGATRAIFSGGTSWLEQHTESHDTEAEMMAEIAMDHGVSESLIICETRSTNTLTNIAYSREFLDDEEPVGIVTHKIHLPRAIKIARRLLDNQLTAITPSNNYPELRTHEFAAMRINDLLLAGIAQGDYEEAIRRNDTLQRIFQRTTQFLPKILAPGMHPKTK